MTILGISMAVRAAAGMTIKGRIMSWSSCSWQRALIRPHRARRQFRMQLDLSGTHLYPQVVPLLVRLGGM